MSSQRLADLVRHQRIALFNADLITEDEYTELAQDHAAVARLEDYDRLRAALDARDAAIKVAEEALRELLTVGDNPDLTFQANRMRFDLAICQAQNALAALAAAKEGKTNEL